MSKQTTKKQNTKVSNKNKVQSTWQKQTQAKKYQIDKKVLETYVCEKEIQELYRDAREKYFSNQITFSATLQNLIVKVGLLVLKVTHGPRFEKNYCIGILKYLCINMLHDERMFHLFEATLFNQTATGTKHYLNNKNKEQTYNNESFTLYNQLIDKLCLKIGDDTLKLLKLDRKIKKKKKKNKASTASSGQTKESKTKETNVQASQSSSTPVAKTPSTLNQKPKEKISKPNKQLTQNTNLSFSTRSSPTYEYNDQYTHIYANINDNGGLVDKKSIFGKKKSVLLALNLRINSRYKVKKKTCFLDSCVGLKKIKLSDGDISTPIEVDYGILPDRVVRLIGTITVEVDRKHTISYNYEVSKQYLK